VQYGAVKKCSQVGEVCTLLDLGGSRVKWQLKSLPMNISFSFATKCRHYISKGHAGSEKVLSSSGIFANDKNWANSKVMLP
jgi:hypothetical protein